MAVALMVLAVSHTKGNLVSGHQFNDPILLATAITTILRGFLYFNWQFFVLALAYPLVMGVLSWGGLRLLAGREGHLVRAADAGRAARAAVAVATLPVWFQEVRAFQVLLWYGLATWLAMVIASLVARQFTRV